VKYSERLGVSLDKNSLVYTANTAADSGGYKNVSFSNFSTIANFGGLKRETANRLMLGFVLDPLPYALDMNGDQVNAPIRPVPADAVTNSQNGYVLNAQGGYVLHG
jgi:hypothetical protein